MAPTARDMTRLTGVHPQLAKAIIAILNELPMFVVQGVRTAEEQHTIWLKGRNAAGQVLDHLQVVTNKDGYVHKSDHQPRGDGLGHAVDCGWIATDPFNESHPWHEYGQMVESFGLTWGGRWSHPHDSPHAELA